MVTLSLELDPRFSASKSSALSLKYLGKWCGCQYARNTQWTFPHKHTSEWTQTQTKRSVLPSCSSSGPLVIPHFTLLFGFGHLASLDRAVLYLLCLLKFKSIVHRPSQRSFFSWVLFLDLNGMFPSLTLAPPNNVIYIWLWMLSKMMIYVRIIHVHICPCSGVTASLEQRTWFISFLGLPVVYIEKRIWIRDINGNICERLMPVTATGESPAWAVGFWTPLDERVAVTGWRGSGRHQQDTLLWQAMGVRVVERREDWGSLLEVQQVLE